MIDLFVGMITGAVDCQAVNATLCIREDKPFFTFSLYPLGIGTLVFLVAGRIFYEFANKESKLLSVSDYRKSLEREQAEESGISREELYEKLRRGKRTRDPNKETIWQTIGRNLSDFWSKIDDFIDRTKEKFLDFIDRQKTKAKERKELKVEMQKIEQEQIEQAAIEEHKQRADRLNKTELVTLISQQTSLSQNDARNFVNALLETIKETVVTGEDVKIAKFGRFSKVHIEEHEEYDPDQDKMVHIEEYNDVEFQPFKQLLEAFGIESEEDEVDEESNVVEENVVVEEPVQEEVVIEEEPEVTEELVQEEVVVAPIVVESEGASSEEPEEDISDDDEEEPKKGKQKEPKEVVVTKTKKDFIEMMEQTTDLSKNKANKFLKYFAEVVKEVLADKDEVELPGLGFFTTIEMPAKEAVNPQTNEPIIVPAHFQVRFRFDEDFKDRVNNEE
jgi:nucleoid DNA-binding protein